MSQTTGTKTVASTKAKGEIGASMLGSEILVSALEREGVDTIFGALGKAFDPDFGCGGDIFDPTFHDPGHNFDAIFDLTGGGIDPIFSPAR